VPVILPLGSLEYRKVSLMASYVPRLPGEEGNGDVIFLFGRIALE
jgi:palmitoyl transferase